MQLREELSLRENALSLMQATCDDLRQQNEEKEALLMQRSVEVNEYKQRCFASEAAMKRLDDELRDMENELRITKAMS